MSRRDLKPANVAELSLASPDPPRRLTLAEAAVEIGFEGDPNGWRKVLRLLRSMERERGRIFLHVEGSGKGRRYSIAHADLEDALGPLISAKRQGDERKGEIEKMLAARLGPVGTQLAELLEKTVVMEQATARLAETIAKLEGRAEPGRRSVGSDEIRADPRGSRPAR